MFVKRVGSCCVFDVGFVQCFEVKLTACWIHFETIV